MIIAKRSIDEKLVGKILRDPIIYEAISGDNSPPRITYKPNIRIGIYVIVYKDDIPIGLGITEKKSAAHYTVHYQVLPDHRGENALAGALECLNWVWRNTQAIKVTAEVPSLYPNVIEFGLSCGFKIEGTNKNSYIKKGKVFDQVYLGIERPEK